MKKTYINPDTKVLIVQTQQMIAASLGFGEDGSADNAESRRRGIIWDDDDE